MQRFPLWKCASALCGSAARTRLCDDTRCDSYGVSFRGHASVLCAVVLRSAVNSTEKWPRECTKWKQLSRTTGRTWPRSFCFRRRRYIPRAKWTRDYDSWCMLKLQCEGFFQDVISFSCFWRHSSTKLVSYSENRDYRNIEQPNYPITLTQATKNTKTSVSSSMRGKQQLSSHQQENREDPTQLDGCGSVQPAGRQLEALVHAGKEIASVKTRPTTPVLANDGGGGFWLATVAAGAGAPAGLPPHGTHHPAMDPTCGSAETGFINSQPSMAEFMTALPQLAGDASLQHSPGTGGSISPGSHHPGYHAMMDPHGVADPSVNVPEYPWMKEKKTTRKSNQQGK